MKPLPIYGSIFAHDALIAAYVSWRLQQEVCEARPDDAVEAALADRAWEILRIHAGNCGWSSETHGPLSAWAPKRVNAYANSLTGAA